MVPDLVSTLCPKKTIFDIINSNLKKDELISIIFGANIPDTTGHQMTAHNY